MMTSSSMILCHGSGIEFEEFDLEELPAAGRTFGRGFYFSNDMALGRQYSGGADPYVARITFNNPFVVDYDLPYDERAAQRRFFRPNATVRERLIEMGHDCVLVRQDGYVEMVVLHPEMIESFGRRCDLCAPDDDLDPGLDDEPIRFGR